MKVKRLSGLALGCFLLVISCGHLAAQAKTTSVVSAKSPGQKVELKIELKNQILYSIYFDSKEIISPSPVSLTINDNIVLGKRPVLENVSRTSVDDKILPAVREKRAVVVDRYE
ncbi:MAG TPA: glycoside hydrolase family 97 N-terminal domain-containing protein, partial [Candidatus Saccharicenans sp.]|nr:glycoside hydrolase family 97 N-terminal domain-containing protein [Candidatus Saccharicenans sp.]